MPQESNSVEIDELYNRAVSLVDKGQVTEAIPFYEKIVDAVPEFGSVHMLLSLIYRDRDDDKMSLPHLHMAYIYGNYEAIKCVDTLREQVGNDNWVIQKISDFLPNRIKEAIDTIRSLNRQIEHTGENDDLLFDIAMNLHELGNHIDGNIYCKKAAKLGHILARKLLEENHISW